MITPDPPQAILCWEAVKEDGSVTWHARLGPFDCAVAEGDDHTYHYAITEEESEEDAFVEGDAKSLGEARKVCGAILFALGAERMVDI